MLLPLDHPV